MSVLFLGGYLNFISESIDISIFGGDWTKAYGVAYVCQHITSPVRIKIFHSFDDLHTNIEGGSDIIIIIAKPRECTFFLYKIATAYAERKILVLSDRFYHSDRVVLKLLGLNSYEILRGIPHCKLEYLLRLPRGEVSIPSEWAKCRVLMHVDNKIFEQLEDYNITNKQRNVLSLHLEGLSNVEIATILRISDKTVSTHKYNALVKLPYGGTKRGLIKNLQVRCLLTPL